MLGLISLYLILLAGKQIEKARIAFDIGLAPPFDTRIASLSG